MDRPGERFVEKLSLRERADEDQYFARRDRGLIEKLRDVRDETRRRNVEELAYMRCPDCGERLVHVTHHGITIEECPTGHGMWMTHAEMETLARRERASWLGRYFYRPRLSD